MTLLRVAPVLVVSDIGASVEFWRERVGFESEGIYGNPPTFAIPTRDGVTAMLAEARSAL